MREAQTYEERRRMNELLWQQSEAIRQLEQWFTSCPGDHGTSIKASSCSSTQSLSLKSSIFDSPLQMSRMNLVLGGCEDFGL